MLAAVEVVKIGVEEDHNDGGRIVLDFSPAGDCLVIASYYVQAVSLRNLRPGSGQHQLERTRFESDEVSFLASCFSPDGLYLVAGGFSKGVQVWDSQSGGPVAKLETYFPVRALEFSPDGRVLVVGGSDPRCMVWNVEKGELVTQLSHDETTGVVGASFSHDGRLLATAGDDGVVRIWDPNTWAIRESVKDFDAGDYLNAVFAPYGPYIAICDGNKLILRDARSRSLLWEANAPGSNSLAFDASGSYVVSGGSTGAVQFWNAQTGAFEGDLRCPDSVNNFAFSRCGTWLAVAGTDFVCLWQLGKSRRTIRSGRFKGAVASIRIGAQE